MADGIKIYKLGRSRLSRGLLDGFSVTPDGRVAVSGEQRRLHLFLPRLDSSVDDCPWGPLAFQAEFQGDAVLTVHAFASNEKQFLRQGQPTQTDEFLLDRAISADQKEKLFNAGGGGRYVGSQDILLYGLTGRYLWLWLELTGPGAVTLSQFRVLTPGDNFFRTFPEIYQTNGDFFHRYLSIFSSLYNDLQDTVDRLHEFVDLDTAPDAALPIFAGWLGLELDGNFLDPPDLRRLLKLAPQLIRAKGTRRAVELIVGLFVEEPAYLVERNLLSPVQREGSELYGEDRFDFTVLIRRKGDEKLRSRLSYLIDQFKPIRSRAHLVFLGDRSSLDAFSYLDVNGAVLQSVPGRMDDGEALTGMTYLK